MSTIERDSKTSDPVQTDAPQSTGGATSELAAFLAGAPEELLDSLVRAMDAEERPLATKPGPEAGESRDAPELANFGGIPRPQSPRNKRPLAIEALGPHAETCYGHNADFKPRRATYSSKQVAKRGPDLIDLFLRAASLLCFLAAAYYGWQWLNQDAPAHGDMPARTARAIPIEDIRVGDRLVGRNPIREQADLVEPDPATWRKTSFSQDGLVYVLRDGRTGELLKVGQTTASKFVGRFE